MSIYQASEEENKQALREYEEKVAEATKKIESGSFGDDIKTGPRGGRYRVTDKGRKSYDVE